MKRKQPKLDREGDYIYVGAYEIGDEVVSLLAQVGDGSGHIYYPYGNSLGRDKPPHSKVGVGCPCITVGLKHRRWRFCLSVLMHEAMEYAYMKLHTRYNCSENWSSSHADYLFVATHEQFSEAIARSALFLTYAMSDLNKIYRMKLKS